MIYHHHYLLDLHRASRLDHQGEGLLRVCSVHVQQQRVLAWTEHVARPHLPPVDESVALALRVQHPLVRPLVDLLRGQWGVSSLLLLDR